MRRKKEWFLLLSLVSLLGVACGRRLSVDALLSNKPKVREAALLRLRAATDVKKKELLPGFLNALRSSNSDLNDRALETLKAMGPSVIDDMRRALKDDEVYVRVCALEVLFSQSMNNPTLVDDLTAALSDSHPLVRSEAAYYLGKLGGLAAGAVPALKKIITNPNETSDVVSSVEEALARIEPTPVKKTVKKTKKHA